MDLLRFITAGSVDDGKSTLIGRLLYDSKSILADQLAAIEKSSKGQSAQPDLALLTDGLRAEREQGITIDVAYRYFNTPKRKFIIADAPGHVQYTRNMVTGVSNSELIVILVDARHGVVEQTRRHSIIASLMGLPQVIVAINKMDMAAYDQAVYDGIVSDYTLLAATLGLRQVHYIPVSALAGDNVVTRSRNMPWYKGPALLALLEQARVGEDKTVLPARFPVQYVIRPRTAALHDYRGYAGKIISGVYAVNDQVTVLPSGIKTSISKLEVNGRSVQQARAPQSITMHLRNAVDVGRGDMIVRNDELPLHTEQAAALVCWLDERPLLPGGRYLLQHNSRRVPVSITELDYLLDVNTLDRQPTPEQITLNEIAAIKLKAALPLALDDYRTNQANGAAILIDERTNTTAAALMFHFQA